MAKWASKTCGNCGFVASGDASLQVINCSECGRDMCAKCYGGNLTDSMCKECRYSQPEVVERLKGMNFG